MDRTLTPRYTGPGSGRAGLAQLKNFDDQFNFHHAFTEQSAFLLDLQAETIIHLSGPIRTFTQGTRDTLNHESYELPTENSSPEEWRLWKTRLEEELAKFGKIATCSLGLPDTDVKVAVAETALIRAKTIFAFQSPKPNDLSDIQAWFGKNSASQERFYSGRDASNFRMVSLNRGPIGRFVKEYVPKRFTNLIHDILVSARK